MLIRTRTCSPRPDLAATGSRVAEIRADKPYEEGSWRISRKVVIDISQEHDYQDWEFKRDPFGRGPRHGRCIAQDE